MHWCELVQSNPFLYELPIPSVRENWKKHKLCTRFHIMLLVLKSTKQMATKKVCVDHILLVQWIFSWHVGHEYANTALSPQKMVIELDEQTKFQPLPEKYQVHMPHQSTALLVGTKIEAILPKSQKKKKLFSQNTFKDSTYQCIIFYNNKNILYLKSVLST